MKPARVLALGAALCLTVGCRGLRHQDAASDTIPFNGYLPVVANGKLGFIDGSGKVAIEPQFEVPPNLSLDEAHFAEGLEPIAMAGKWGYVGPDGKFVINPQFDAARQFSEGRGAVLQSGKWGFVDKTGATVVPPQLDAVYPFKDGRALVQVGGKWGYIGTDGKYLINPQFEAAGNFADHFADVMVDGKWGLIDENGKFTITPQFDYVGDFLDGRAPVQVGGKFGYVDSEGKLVINPQYVTASSFRSSRARAAVGNSFGFIDSDGKFVINPQFDGAEDFRNGVAAVSTGGRWGYVGTDGRYVINPQFEAAAPFWDDLAFVRQGGKAGFIDKRGRFVVSPDLDDAAAQPVGQFRWVQKDDKIGYIDATGHYVWPLTSVLALDSLNDRDAADQAVPAVAHGGLQAAFAAAARLQEGVRARVVQRRFIAALPANQRSRLGSATVAPLDQDASGYVTAGSWMQAGVLVPSGQAVSVSARSTDFDTVLQVYAVGPDGDRLIGANDDADGTNSRLNLCAGPGGPRLLYVSSFGQGRSGNAIVRVSRLGADAANCAQQSVQPVATADTMYTTPVDTTRAPAP